MNKPLSRRIFARTVVAAPVALADAMSPARIAELGATVGPGIPGMASMGYSASNARIIALAHANLLPAWMTRRSRKLINERRNILPNVAACRSMSLTAKLRMSADHQERSDAQNLVTDLMDETAHSEFFYGQRNSGGR